MSVWKRQALREAQEGHRLGTFDRQTRWVAVKLVAWGAAGGILLTVWLRFRRNLLSPQNFWSELAMWVTVVTVVGAIGGFVRVRVLRSGLRAMRELRDSGFCPFCSYDLRGAPSTRCSECGRDSQELDSNS